MDGQPGATLTLLFTDIEGSTRLLRRLGDRYALLHAEHEQLLQQAIEAHGGTVVDEQGDSLFASFPAAREALLAAIEADRALAGHRWPDGVSLRVRIGIHTGEPVQVDGHVVGLAVHHAARLMSAAHGGQILVSDATRRLLAEGELDGVELRDLGVQTLPDFPDQEHVYQVIAPGLPTAFPPLRRPRPALTRRRRAAWYGVGAAGLAVALGVGVTLGARSAPVRVEPGTVGLIDPARNAVVAAVAVGGQPEDVALGEGGVWVASQEERTLARIDPDRRRLEFTVSLAGEGLLGEIAVTPGAVWVGRGPRDLSLDRVDLGLRTVTRTIELGWVSWPAYNFAEVLAVVAGEGAVWSAAGPLGTVARVDPSSGEVTGRIDSGVWNLALAVGSGELWAAGDSAVARMDTSALVATSRLPARRARGIALGGGAAWLACETDRLVERIEASTGAVTTIAVDGSPVDVAFGSGAVWVALAGDTGAVARIDPSTNEVVAVIELDALPEAIAADDRGVWVAAAWPEQEEEPQEGGAP